MSAIAPATPEPVFSVRIVSLDHYMARPEPGLDVCYSELEGTVVERVPIVRIFGTTPLGQKTCLHLHKVLDAHTIKLLASVIIASKGCNSRHACPVNLVKASMACAVSACLVYAQVFPYFYVPYPDDAPVEQGPGESRGFAQRACKMVWFKN